MHDPLIHLKSGTKIRILLVDDSPLERIITSNHLEAIFSASQLKITQAVDGKEAIDFLGDLKTAPPFDLILLDLVMPNVDGYGVLKWLKSKALPKKFPQILVYSRAEEESIDRSLITHYLYKQVKTSEELAQAIRPLIASLI